MQPWRNQGARAAAAAARGVCGGGAAGAEGCAPGTLPVTAAAVQAGCRRGEGKTGGRGEGQERTARVDSVFSGCGSCVRGESGRRRALLHASAQQRGFRGRGRGQLLTHTRAQSSCTCASCGVGGGARPGSRLSRPCTAVQKGPRLLSGRLQSRRKASRWEHCVARAQGGLRGRAGGGCWSGVRGPSIPPSPAACRPTTTPLHPPALPPTHAPPPSHL